ncbi:MAG: glycerophosphodiester phosphodiesterase, partial [Granulicatella sp.]|nr:glycerophosphodiester phosphodiesterase [Granulicatella sp.]
QERMQPNFAIIYSSFNPRSIIQMKQLRPNQEIAFLYETVEMANYEFEKVNFEAVHPDYRLLKESFGIHSQYPKRVWTVNQEDEMNHCFELKVEAIFTDYPQKALELRSEIKE